MKVDSSHKESTRCIKTLFVAKLGNSVSRLFVVSNKVIMKHMMEFYSFQLSQKLFTIFCLYLRMLKLTKLDNKELGLYLCDLNFSACLYVSHSLKWSGFTVFLLYPILSLPNMNRFQRIN